MKASGQSLAANCTSPCGMSLYETLAQPSIAAFEGPILGLNESLCAGRLRALAKDNPDRPMENIGPRLAEAFWQREKGSSVGGVRLTSQPRKTLVFSVF